MELPDTGSTRSFDTVFGELSYAEVSERVAEPLRQLLNAVVAGEYSYRPLDPVLVQDFHHRIVDGIMPDIAGVFRKQSVRVGSHYPPEHQHVSREMWQCFNALEGKLEYVGSDTRAKLELLAFAEAQVLSVHPFKDFNGRAVRVLITELMVRLDVPVVELAVERDTPEHVAYVSALRAFDLEMDISPLLEFWADYRLPRALG